MLGVIKADAELKSIPVIVLANSDDPGDVTEACRLGAKCHVRKPPDLTQLKILVKAIDSFWLNAATIPSRKNEVVEIQQGATR